jgi:hypothetical protein
MRLVHRFVVVAALAVLAVLPGMAHAGWGVGIRIGVPYPYGYYYGGYPYGYYPYGYYYGAPVVVQPGVTVVQPPATVVQPGNPTPNLQPVPPSPGNVLPPPRPATSLEPVSRDLQAEALVAQLRSGDDQARSEAANQLGRRQAVQAAEPLTTALASDRSPLVRDAAARALGQIANPTSLEALQRAAQVDDDREVRASARFAADVIRDRLRNR